ncbi:MAG: hypothetical protein FJ090_07310 [Deltaproteobacteria bacterium]|nr:hypothetical protein [Deltaproteobacteria bacterium]
MSRLLPFSLLFALGCPGDDAKEDSGPVDSGGDDAFVVEQNDADADGILDIHEGEDDADGDGTPNFEDTDSDGDGLNDKKEAGDDDVATLPVDSDGDGVADYLDEDSDNNCVKDGKESNDSYSTDTDGDGSPDHVDSDNDGDGIPDLEEIGACEKPDTDGDGTPDYMDQDSDGDGIGDSFEGGTTEFNDEPRDSDGDGIDDYLDSDSDNDGISDGDEGGTGGNLAQEPRDTDGDGKYDFQDTDADGDALSDADELLMGTDPYDDDTDGDGYSDGGEYTAGTDPLDASSVIDGIYVEVQERTTVEEEFEFELSIQRGDVGFIIDTTCSMGGTITAIASEFNTLVGELESVLPDAAYAVTGHDDYAYGSFGSPGSDKPYYMRQQITTDTSLVQTGFASLSTHSGADGPESGTEAIYQAASGAGYDQDCDGSYDTSTDVMPFIASATDPFGGGGGEHYDSSTPDGGVLGGMGFREYSLPVVVLAGDNYLRDSESSNGMYNGTPGGCPIDAGMSDAETAFLDLGAYFVGVSVNGTTGYPQMYDFAEAIGSYADLDGDGVAAEPVVETWSGSNAEFRETLVNAITQLVAGVRFERVDLSVDGDTYGFVQSIEPEYYEGLGADDEGMILTFTLTFRGVVAALTEDQLYVLSLNVLGDQSILLDTLDIVIVVPGQEY